MSRPCPACGGNDRIDANFHVQQQFPLFHCAKCGLGALDIEGAQEEGFDEYWSDVNQRIYAEPAVLAELSHKYDGYFRKVLVEVPNKRFLDVGSGVGASIATAAKLGFDVTGIEPSENAVKRSRRMYDLPVIQGLLHAGDTLPRNYGMLALWDVIEHVSDPAELIQACHQHLSEGGILILETPDEGTLLRAIVRFVGRMHIPGLEPRASIYYRAHRFYFTRKAMTYLLQRCGFSQIRFYPERTMYQKELRKKQLYEGLSPMRLAILRIVFAVLKHFPLMSNKMVVIAVKART